MKTIRTHKKKKLKSRDSWSTTYYCKHQSLTSALLMAKSIVLES